MKTRSILLALVASLAVLLAALLTGCGSVTDNSSDRGYLTLSVNPSIRIEYNADGLVTGLEGRNEDGTAIANAYTDYIGKDCSTVLRELVTDIYKAGYFIEDADSGKRQIVLQIEPGSALPDDDFLELLHRDVASTVSDLALTSDVVDIDRTDYDTRYEKDGQPSGYITLAKARQIALTHAGVSEADAVWDDREFDFENGRPVYELEFTAGGVEYDYDIDATNGKILRAKTDRDDDRSTPGTAAAPSTGAASATSYIGLEEARQIALERAGVSAGNVRWEDNEFDLDDGTPLYELEFTSGGYEYSVDVHAITGKVLEYDAERDD